MTFLRFVFNQITELIYYKHIYVALKVKISLPPHTNQFDHVKVQILENRNNFSWKNYGIRNATSLK